MAIYGGFAGTETARDERDWKTNVTTLSGEIGDGSVTTDNSCHVVFSNNTDHTAILDGFTITDGYSDNGGCSDGKGAGIFNVGTPTLSNLTIAHNKSLSSGGGIYNTTNANATLTNVLILGNEAASEGGGMLNINASPTLINVLIAGNKAVNGGGMYNNTTTTPGSNPVLTNVTIASNTSNNGGGISNRNSAPKLQNSIIWGNNSIDSQCLGGCTYTNSLVEGLDLTGTGTGNLNGTTATPDFVAPEDASNAPMSLAGDYRLLETSDAIDVGNNDDNTEGTDLDGETRISHGTVDLGAYEVPVVLIVNDDGDASDANAGDGSCATAGSVCTLRAAVEEANALAGDDTITFDGDYTIVLGSVITIDSNLTIDGETNAIELSGNDASRIFLLSTTNSPVVTLSNLTLRNGNDTGTSPNRGGAVAAEANTTLNIDSCLFHDNTSSGGYGGAIRSYGTMTIENTTFRNNKGYSGGAVYGGKTTIRNSTFYQNTTTNYGGSAILNWGNTYTIENCTFVENQTGGSSGSDGTIQTRGTGVTIIKHSTLLNNSSVNASAGAGVYSSDGEGASMQMSNTVIYDTHGGPDCTGNLTVNENNWIGDGTCSPAHTGDPQIGTLADNGGTTQTVLPQTGSGLMDAITNGTSGCGTELTTDQRGEPRPGIAGGECDIGAVEVAPIPAILTISKTVDNSTPAPGETVAYTITVVNNSQIAHSNIIVTDTLPTNLTYVADSLTIDGTPQTGTTLPDPLVEGKALNTGGDSFAITFQATAGSSLAKDTVLENIAGVSSDEMTDVITDSVSITITPPEINLTPTTLTFNATTGGSNPAAQTVGVTNSGGGTLDWTATTSTDDGADWLSVATASGTAPSDVSVQVDITGLSAGMYTGKVSISSTAADNTPQEVAVTLNVTDKPKPNMQLTPATLTFDATEGGSTPPAQTVKVATDSDAFNWTASTDAAWLSIQPANGTAPSSFSVQADITGLSQGTYNGTVSISSAEAGNSPQEVAVTLKVAAAGPAVHTVDLNISLYRSPGSSQTAYEDVIKYFADAVYEMTNGAHQLGVVNIYTNGKNASTADIVWKQSGNIAAFPCGISYRGATVTMVDVNARDGFNFLAADNLDFAGYDLGQYWAYYYYGLYSEAFGAAGSHPLPMVPLLSDTPVEPSVLYWSWVAAVKDNLKWLNFSTAENNTRQTAQHRVYGASAWETLARSQSQDPRNGILAGFPKRIYYPELTAAAVTSGQQIDLPSDDARSSLDIRWDGVSAKSIRRMPRNVETTTTVTPTAYVNAMDGTAVTAPAPVVIMAHVVITDGLTANLGVDAVVTDPDSVTSTLTLMDDGVAPDMAANDGYYTGMMPYDQDGAYQVAVTFDNKDGDAAIVFDSLSFAINDMNADPDADEPQVIYPDPVAYTDAFTTSSLATVVVDGYAADDHGASSVESTEIMTDNTDIWGSINKAGDTDYFTVTVESDETPQVLRVTSFADGMVAHIKLSDKDGNPVGEGEYNVTQDDAEYFYVELPTGTTFIEVKHQDANATSGWYAISAGDNLHNGAELVLTAPVAEDDTESTDDTTPIDIDVLANDTDPDVDDTLTIEDVGTPSSGTAAVNGNKITYTPTSAFSGTATFTYTISDDVLTDTATVSVKVTANTAPVAVDDTASTVDTDSIDIDVLANDSDPDGDTLTISEVGTPTSGTAVIQDSKITYTPTAEYSGTATFDYTISDGTLTDSAMVTVTVTKVNVAPVAVDDEASTTDTVAIDIDVLKNDSDPDGDTLTISEVGTPTSGTAVIQDSKITYTPTAEYSGTATFDYTISDGTLTDSAMVTVTVTTASVVDINTAPVAVDDEASTTDTVAIDIDVLKNDSDPDGDTLTISAVGTPSNGTATISGGKIAYTPTAEYSGTATFDYTISDGKLTDTAMVTVAVTTVPVKDNTPPEKPLVDGDDTGDTRTITTTNRMTIINGTAEPKSRVRLTIDLGNSASATYNLANTSVTYETTTDASGNWSIDLANDTPTSGSLPEGGLAPGSYAMTFTATDANGNTSDPTNMTLTVVSSGYSLFLPVIINN